MGYNFQDKAREFLEQHKRAHRTLALFLCMAAAAVIGTFSILTLHGQALTADTRKLACACEVHAHTDDCYQTEGGEKTLICGHADYVVHSHNGDCYDADGDLVCPLPEIEEHHHTAACYETERALSCGQAESGSHTHSDACYTEEKKLVCGKQELHTHTDACYETAENGKKALSCGLLELQEHVHGEECFQVLAGDTLQATAEDPEPEGAAPMSSGQEAADSSPDGQKDEPQAVSDEASGETSGSDLKGFVERVEIKDADGNPIGDGMVHVGETYHIHLEFKEKGAQHEQFAPPGQETVLPDPGQFQGPGM